MESSYRKPRKRRHREKSRHSNNKENRHRRQKSPSSDTMPRRISKKRGSAAASASASAASESPDATAIANANKVPPSTAKKPARDLEEKVAALERQNAALMKENAEIGHYQLIPTSTVKSSDLSEAMENAFKSVVRSKIWRFCKFVPSTNKEEMRLGAKIFTYMAEKIPRLKDMNSVQKENWIRCHLNIMGQKINQTRSYATSEMKKAAMKEYESHNKTLPSLDMVVACAKRDLDLSNPDHVNVLNFYWDVILPRACGNMNDWGKDKRFYSTIQEAAPLDNPKKVFVTPSTEAFCVLTYHNNRDSWVAMAEVLDKVDGNKKLVHAKKKGQEDKGIEETATTVKLYGKKYKPLWSESDSGSSRKGGFTKDGLKQFKKYVDMITAARKKPESLELEKEFLVLLRKKHDVTGNSIEEDNANKKRKRVDNGPAEEEEEVIELEYSSEEEEAEYEE